MCHVNCGDNPLTNSLLLFLQREVAADETQGGGGRTAMANQTNAVSLPERNGSLSMRVRRFGSVRSNAYPLSLAFCLTDFLFYLFDLQSVRKLVLRNKMSVAAESAPASKTNSTHQVLLSILALWHRSNMNRLKQVNPKY